MPTTREHAPEPPTRRTRGARVVALALCGAAVTTACAGPPAGAEAPTPANAMKAIPGNAMQAAAAPLAFRATTIDGAAFDGASLRGRPAVLWFWAAWCSVCAGEAPTVAKVAAANPGVRFVGVSALDELPAMKKFVADRGIGGFPQLADQNAEVWRRFGVTSQPAHAFVSSSGEVKVVPGALSEQELSEQVAALGAR